jgi:RNA polymerase sigma-70 factor (ECF subfamily)
VERGDVDLPSVPTADVDTDAATTPQRQPEPLPDFLLAAAVDDAVIGDVLADLPEAQPTRPLHSATDFSSLYIRHRSGLAAHARRYLRDARDVDEVVQETFLRLFLAISEIETELQAIAFARRTLTNLCIDRYRADKRRPTLITLDANPYFDLTGADEDPDPVLQAEDAAIVRDALARLSPLHRAALVKREIEEKALPQIAAELGVAEESVKHLLFRARRALRRLLIGTSVEPGVDLTGDCSGLPPKGTGSPLLRSAPVFIFFLVAALVAGVGVRSLLSGGGTARPATDAIGAPGLNLSGPDGVAPKGSEPKPSHRHHRVHPAGPAPADPVAPTSSASSGSSQSRPIIRINEPQAVIERRPKGPAPTGEGATRSHFKLSGPLKVTGAPQVNQGGVTDDGNGSTLSLSSFNAPTDQGFFDLVQTVKTSHTSGTSVAVKPAFVVGNEVHEADLTGSTAAVGTDAAGNVTVDLVASAQPDDSRAAFPLASLTAHMVLAPDLSRVLSETVTLGAQPQTTVDAPPEADGQTPPAETGADQARKAPPPEGAAGPSQTTSKDCSLATGTASGTVTCAAQADTKPSRPASITPEGGP